MVIDSPIYENSPSNDWENAKIVNFLFENHRREIRVFLSTLSKRICTAILFLISVGCLTLPRTVKEDHMGCVVAPYRF
jgi:hypothetical protein